MESRIPIQCGRQRINKTCYTCNKKGHLFPDFPDGKGNQKKKGVNVVNKVKDQNEKVEEQSKDKAE